MNKKIISFSLWGQNPKYTVGAIRNAELASELYPDWTCRFYCANSVPFQIIYQLEDFKNVEIFHRDSWGDWTSMFWRFEPASEDNVDIMISRDTDSRLSLREKAAVDEWESSNFGFHIMRDHPYHKYKILGGMWGAKKGTLPQMKALIDNFSQKDSYGTDYEFFNNVIFQLIDDRTLVHDEFFAKKSFPLERDLTADVVFVGEVFDHQENFNKHHRDVLLGYLNKSR